MKLAIYSLLILQLFFAQDQPKQVKLALSGGGARGFAHLGVIKALEEYGIEVTEIVGTSAGALVGALYAAGNSPKEIELKLRELISSELIFSDYSRKDIPIERKFETSSNFIDIGINNEGPVLPSSLTGDSRLNFYLIKFFAEADLAANGRFKKLPIPLTVVASDVFAEKAIYIESGDLAKSIRASISIPTALPAIEINKRALIDGGIYNNLATNRFKEDDFVIAVNTASETYKEKDELKSVFDMMGHMVNILSSKSDSNSVDNWDLFIEPNLIGYTATDWFEIDSLVSLGYREAVRVLKRAGYKKTKVSKVANKSKAIHFEDFKVSSVKLKGSYRLTKEHIMKNLGIDIGSYFSWDLMQQGINRLYAQKLIQKFWVNFAIVDDKLNLFVEIKEDVLTRITLGGFTQNKMGNNLNLGVKFIGRLGFAESISFNAYAGDFISGFRLGVRYNSLLDIPMFDYFNFDSYNYKPTRFDSLEARYTISKAKYSTGLQLGREMMMLGTIGYSRTEHKIGANRNIDKNIEEMYNTFFIQAEFVLESLDDLYFPTSGSSINASFSFNQIDFVEANGAAIPANLEGGLSFHNQFTFEFTNHKSVLNNSLIFSQDYEFSTIINQKTSTVPLLGRNRLDLTRSTMGFFDPQFYKFHYLKFNYSIKQETYDNIYLYGSYSVAKEWQQLENIQFKGFDWDHLHKGFELGIYIPTFLGPISLTYSHDDFFQNAIRLSTGFIR